MDAQLWFDEDRESFYVIPTDTALPQGSRWLRTFDGVPRGFDADALLPYKVEKEAAQPYLRAWIEGGYQKARDAFARGYGEEAPLPDSLQSALGVDPATLTSDPDALGQALSHLGIGVKRWLDEEAPPEVRQSLQGAASALSELFQQLSEPPAADEDPDED